MNSAELKRRQVISEFREEVEKIKASFDLLYKRTTSDHFPTEAIQRYSKRVKDLNDFIEEITSTIPS